jgi:hypothetical protein
VLVGAAATAHSMRRSMSAVSSRMTASR